MLTDRQLVALALIANTVNNEVDLVYLARGKGTTEKMIKFALKFADKFLECSQEKNV